MKTGQHRKIVESQIDFDSICRKIRSAMEPLRAHALSLHDEQGEILWLSEGSLGPDEHDAVREALTRFSNLREPAVLAYDLGDARSAVVLRAVDSHRAIAGVVMAIMDTRALKPDQKGGVVLMTPTLQRALADFADMQPRAARSSATVHKPVVARSPIALYIQRFIPVIKGGDMARYEVAPRAMLESAVQRGLGCTIDRRIVTELLGWLEHHPDVWQSHEVMFSVKLTGSALHDQHFMKFVELCLMKSSLPPSMIAFEVDVPTAVKLEGKIGSIAGTLERLGCLLVLDDFALRTECFDLLRLPAVRYIKMDPQITATMRTDKVSQAAVTALVQMARVLGMYTVAKRTDTAPEREWLAALGVDFIQSNAGSPPVPLDTLSAP